MFCFGLCQIQRREKFLQTLTNHLNLLLGIIEPVQHQQTFLKTVAKRLPTMMQHILHPAKIDDSESHLTTTNLDEPDKILAIGML